MAYRLTPDETPADGVRRAAAEQLDDAREQLTGRVARDPVTAIHEARKSLKKTRALVRLAREGLGEGTYAAENARLRDAGRRLSGLRDAEVVLQALDTLAERYAGQVPQATFDRVRAALAAERDAARERGLAGGADAAEVAAVLAEARSDAGAWPLATDGWPLIEPGLRRAYARGRRRHRAADEDPTVENLHEWRKRVKDLWYHLRFLQPAWPAVLEAEAEEAHRLSELLGDDHDLAVLGERLSDDPAVYAEVASDLDPLLELIERRRGDLLAEARRLGARLYAERPKAFGRRLRALWRAHEAELRPPAGAAG